MKLKQKLAAGAFVAMTFAAAAAYAVPGPQRMLMPQAYGLTAIATGVFTDDPSKAGLEMLLISRANAKVKALFGDLEASPRYILCTTLMCEKTFGKMNRIAVTYGWHALHIPPKGINDAHLAEILLAHERVHSELHKRWGAVALLTGKFPNWFDEGLATYISGDDRIRLDHSQDDIAWISNSRSFYDWDSFVRERGWKDAYGSAASYVAAIHARAGDEGLHSLIERTAKGEDFDTILAEIMVGENS